MYSIVDGGHDVRRAEADRPVLDRLYTYVRRKMIPTETGLLKDGVVRSVGDGRRKAEI